LQLPLEDIRAALGIYPAIEYSFFPYVESNQRELRLLYEIGFEFRHYDEITIYDKTKENLTKQKLTLKLEYTQPWGELRSSLFASHFFQDFSKNRVEFDTDVSISLFKGFSLSVSSGLSMIHDQLSLPKEDVTTEDLLLQRQELETEYRFWGVIGFSYSFGSMYNNIVNPRF